MPKTYVALDLETTGLDVMRDAIIEIGALRFAGERVLDRLSMFVNPGRKIPPFITDLTGITDADVEGAIGARQAVHDLAQFVGRDPVVGHNIEFDLAFLRRHGVLNGNPAIDTFSLAGVLVPHAGRYSLASLVRELGIDLPDQTHRALDDAVMAHALFLELFERAVQLPQQVLKEIVRLGKRVNWGPTAFFSDALAALDRQGFSGGIGAQLAARRGGDGAGPLFVDEQEYEPLIPRREPVQLDLDTLTRLLEADGELTAAFPEYEYREQQVEMMQAVGQAFNEGKHLLVEAGTGTGKSLAYLVPAIAWARQNSQRVVISTNTINLQEQLADKDIPQLRGVINGFRHQVLKGRAHYLCRQQFEALRRRGPGSADEMQVLAKVLLWLPNTLDGDGDALFLPTPGERAVWHSISAGNEACDPERCRFHQGDACFFYRARDRAEGAHLLVVNHALLLADLATGNRVLPEYELLIVDEAHHMERAATESLRYTVSWPMLLRAFDDLLGGRGYAGSLEALHSAEVGLSRRHTLTLQEAAVRLADAAERTGHQLDLLFEEMERLLSQNSAQNDGYAVRLRVTPQLRDEADWGLLARSWHQLQPHFSALVEGLTKLVGGLEELSVTDVSGLDAVRARLLASMQVLGEAYGHLHRFLIQPDENAVYWLESQGRGPLTLHAVPLHVGALVREHLLNKKRSVILTSATLRIDGSFDYLRDRLGVTSAEELAVGSPFDYPSAALLYVVSDIPEPRGSGYQEMVNQTLVELFTATEGRALALFTSYQQLRASAQAITGKLSRAGITVYAQGMGGSRAQLLESFRKGDKSVLLGTRSFWEGVDVPGEALSCLVIVKLPFDVPNDPLVAARSEGYDDPFNAYMVPEAVLRFMQGFGRLIRTATDQGIAVVLDQRIMTKAYGSRFIASLPDPKVYRGGRARLPEIARRWLAGEPLGSGELADPEFDDTWAMEAAEGPEEPSWFWGA